MHGVRVLSTFWSRCCQAYGGRAVPAARCSWEQSECAMDALQRRQARYIPLIVDWDATSSSDSRDSAASGSEIDALPACQRWINSGSAYVSTAPAEPVEVCFEREIPRAPPLESSCIAAARLANRPGTVGAASLGTVSAACRDMLERPGASLRNDKGNRGCCLSCLHTSAQRAQVDVP